MTSLFSSHCDIGSNLSIIQNEMEKNDFVIYPNPAHSQLTVDSKQYSISSMEVRDLLGQVVYSGKANRRKEVKINLSEFSKGVYFLKVFFEDGVSALPSLQKFIKQ